MLNVTRVISYPFHHKLASPVSLLSDYCKPIKIYHYVYADNALNLYSILKQTSCAGGRHNMPTPPALAPCKFTFDLLTLKVVS